MQIVESVSTASEVIQHAVAPVFLLMGVSALLGVLTGRLGRVVDRFRSLSEQCSMSQLENPVCINYKNELKLLANRGEWVHWSITLCTITLLLVAVIIGVLFLGAAVSWKVTWLVPPIFIAAMLSLILGLGCFLREIYLSKHTFRLPE